MKRHAGVIYTTLATLFAVVGTYTLFNVFLGLRIEHVVLLMSLVYTEINYAMAYGLYTRQRWILWVSAANTVASALLLSASVFLSTTSWRELLALACNAALLWFLYKTRSSQRNTPLGLLVGVSFLVAWVVALGYTIFI